MPVEWAVDYSRPQGTTVGHSRLQGSTVDYRGGMVVKQSPTSRGGRRWIQGEDRLDYLMTRKKRKAERRFPRRGMRLHCCRFHCW